MLDPWFRSTFFRKELAHIVAGEPEMEDLRLQAVTDYVATLKPDSGLILYGCGSLSASLAREHGDLLGRVGAVFVTTA
jgi:hypothetical protein